MDCRDNGASGTSFARRFLSPLLLPGSCLTPKRLVSQKGSLRGGRLWAGVVDDILFFTPFLFAQVDHFGEGLTHGYRLGLTLQNQGEAAILQPVCRACENFACASSQQQIRSHSLPAQGIQGSERFSDFGSVTRCLTLQLVLTILFCPERLNTSKLALE